jgi:hypothetical protein
MHARRGCLGIRDNGGEGARRIVLPGWPGVYGPGDQAGLRPRGQTFHEDFNSAGRRYQGMALPQDALLPRSPVGANGHSIDTHHSQRLQLVIDQQLQIQVGDGRGIQDPP